MASNHISHDVLPVIFSNYIILVCIVLRLSFDEGCYVELQERLINKDDDIADDDEDFFLK